MAPEERAPTVELREYLRFLRRRKAAVLAVILLCLTGAAALAAVQRPMYAATAEVLLQRRTSEFLFNPITGQNLDPQRAVDTEIRVLEGQAVRESVRAQVGGAPTVEARPAARTDIIEVRAEQAHPERAAAVANAYAEAYIEFRRKQAVDDLFAAAEQVQRKLGDLQRRMETLPPSQAQELVRVQSLFREELDKLQVNAELRTGGAQVLTRATAPAEPFEPQPVRNLLIGLVVGLVLGIALAVVLEYLDDSVRTRDDLQRAAPSLPVLGMIPVVPGWRNGKEPRLVSLSDSMAPATEAYRTLRTAVQFLGVGESVRTLQIVSPSAEEGKTTTLVNLGVALARTGQRVVLVDADLRRPRLHEFFGMSNAVGMTSVIRGDVSLGDAAQAVPDVDGLLVLASGPLPPSTSEFLSLKATHALLAALRTGGYFTLVDSPPVLPVTDGLVLGRHVDATLLVAFAGRTSRRELSRAVELLQQVRVPIAGIVLNGATTESDSGYSYRYYAPSSNGKGQKKALKAV